jgi:hypothetical protein
MTSMLSHAPTDLAVEPTAAQEPVAIPEPAEDMERAAAERLARLQEKAPNDASYWWG